MHWQALAWSIAFTIMIFTRFHANWNPDVLALTTGDIFRHLVLINLIMGVFNLVPVFPMDGGRVLRAILARRLSYLKATRIAVVIGKILAVCGILVMVFHFKNYLGGALFAFIFVAGKLEWRALRRTELEAGCWHDMIRRQNWPSSLPPAVGSG